MCIEERLPLVGPIGYPGCPKWILEIKFETDFGTVFSMPVRFHASTREDASFVSEALRLGFEENYSVKILLGPYLSLSSLAADRLRKVVNNDVAQRDLLVYWLQDPAVAGRPPMAESKALQLIGERLGIGSVHRSTKLEQRISVPGQRISVYKVREGIYPQADEPLFLWVVEPRFILSHILIAINGDSWATSGTLRVLEEGKWMSAGVKDYMYRIDRGHHDPEVRHVHICHEKHRTARNRQVSWSEDGTRHDPLRFDVGFVGIETAKQIAREVLHLPDDFVLEDRCDLPQEQLLEESQVDTLPPVSCAFKGFAGK